MSKNKSKKNKKSGGGKSGKKGKGMAKADGADRYALYLDSVQEPSHEVSFFKRAFKKEFGREPVVLREDFCGTAAVCYEWV